MICNKCNIDQPESNYETYWHSTQQKNRTRRICRTCISNQKKQYKLRIKQMNKVQPEVLKSEPEVFDPLSTDKDYKKCTKCLIYKHKENDFYLNANRRSRFSMCKRCCQQDRKKYPSKRAGDPAERYYPQPNRYYNEEQRLEVFGVMERLGYLFNSEKGIWYKEGWKTKDGVFLKIRKHKRKGISGKVIPDHVKKNIIELKKQGKTIKEIIDIHKVSHSTIEILWRKEKESWT